MLYICTQKPIKNWFIAVIICCMWNGFEMCKRVITALVIMINSPSAPQSTLTKHYVAMGKHLLLSLIDVAFTIHYNQVLNKCGALGIVIAWDGAVLAAHPDLEIWLGQQLGGWCIVQLQLRHPILRTNREGFCNRPLQSIYIQAAHLLSSGHIHC